MQPKNSTPPNQSDQSTQPNSPFNRSKPKKPLFVIAGTLLLAVIAVGVYLLLQPHDVDGQPDDKPDNTSMQSVEKEFTSEGGIPVRVTSEFNNEGATLSSPLEFTGSVPMTWGEEGSFSVRLFGDNNNLLGEGAGIIDTAQAVEYVDDDGNPVLDGSVPFYVTLDFEAPPAGSTGQLILNRDNSGLFDEADDSIVIDVTF